MDSSPHPRWRKYRTLFLWGGCGFCIGALCVLVFVDNVISPRPIQQNLSVLRSATASSTYQYVDPLLAVVGLDASSSIPYVGLNNLVNTYISQQENEGALLTASVYFRDLGTTGGFTLNPTQTYTPASLLKVPVMMVYYKIAETDPQILQQQLTYTGDTNADATETIVSPIQLVPDTSYTVDELIQHMIKYSDNNALNLLINYLNSTGNYSVFDTLFGELGLSHIDLSGEDSMTAGQYSLFFRVLYNATYLSPDASEQALELLTQTDFSQGLSAGVPSDIDVAQKFGEFSLIENGITTDQELNTCGTVYYPGHPYLLCVMTKGTDFKKLEETLQGVSEEIFNFTERLYPPQEN